MTLYVKILIIFAYVLFADLSHAKQSVNLVKVNDGDTITVTYKNSKKQVKVRLYGIDAPELAQPYGQESRKHLHSLLSGGNIVIKDEGTDTYGRVLGTLYINQTNINLQMVKDGYAWHYKQYSKSKNLEKAQKYAQENNFGLWQEKNPQEPWLYRQKSRNTEYANNKPLIKSPIEGLVVCFNPTNYKIDIRSDNCPKGQITIMK